MKCPVDQTPLLIADRQGIEVDYCPTCRGVWLDRGELDKLVERSSSFGGGSEQPREERREQYDDRRDSRDRDQRHYDEDHHEDRGHHGKSHKKESFLGDIFDF